MIPFPEWAPDVAPLNNIQVTDNVNNVSPGISHWEPVKQLVDYTTTALPTGKGLGAIAATDADLTTIKSFYGTTTKLYTLDQTNKDFDDVSKLTVSYATPKTAQWKFYQWGNLVVALNGEYVPQKFDIGADSNFTDLGGSPVAVRYGAVVNEFAVHGHNPTTPNKIYWSSIGNNEEWTAGTNLGGEQDFPDGGIVQGITGGRASGLIYQEEQIRRMTFVGGTAVFRIDQILDIGCKAPYSLTTCFGNNFFYSNRGFVRLSQDGEVDTIGDERVDHWFRDNALETSIPMMVGACDPRSKRVWWLFSSNDAGSYHDTVLIYDWGVRRWGKASVDGSYIFSLITSAATLESLDTPYPDLDAMTISLDDPVFNSAVPAFGILNERDQLATFSGTPSLATIDTATFQLTPGRAVVHGITPIGDTNSMTVSTGYKEKTGDDFTFTTATSTEVNGEAPQRASGRYFKARVSIPAGTDWSMAHGIADPRFSSDGDQ